MFSTTMDSLIAGLLCLTLTIQEQMQWPFVALVRDAQPERHSAGELKAFKSGLENERAERIENDRKLQDSWRKQLDAARAELKKLNAASSHDNAWAASRRAALHTEIAALEQSIHEKQTERERMIEPEYAIKVAKLHVLAKWPQRHDDTARRIDRNLARQRQHGDIDDISYRALAGNANLDRPTGEQAARQIAFSGRMPPEVQEVEVREYVQRLAVRIASNSDLKTPLQVRVLDTPEVNAISLPGGFLFITSGLILTTGSEAELAGVIAREIAHIAARHGIRASKHSIIAKLFTPASQLAAGIFTGGFSNVGTYYGVNYGLQSLGVLVDRALTGSIERYQGEADQLGIQYAWKTGFDPAGFIAFLDSIAKSRNYSAYTNFFHTKSSLGDRILDAFTEVQYLPSYAVPEDSEEFQRSRNTLRH
jgi:hypothetical protein